MAAGDQGNRKREPGGNIDDIIEEERARRERPGELDELQKGTPIDDLLTPEERAEINRLREDELVRISGEGDD